MPNCSTVNVVSLSALCLKLRPNHLLHNHHRHKQAEGVIYHMFNIALP